MESHNKSKVFFIVSKTESSTNKDPLKVETDSIINEDIETFHDNESADIIEPQLKTFDDQEAEDNVEQMETFDGENYENIIEETLDDETFAGIDEELEALEENKVETTKTFNKENFENVREDIPIFNEVESEDNIERVKTFDEDNCNMTEQQNNTIIVARRNNINNEMARNSEDNVREGNANAEDTIETINKSKQDIKSKCPICEKEFPGQYWKGNMQVHMKNTHKINIKKLAVKFKCDVCDATFATKSNLQTHINTVHLNMRVHACSQCTKSYSEKRNLNRHIREVHMKIKALKTQEKQVHLLEKHEGNIEKVTSFVEGNYNVTENSKIDEFKKWKRNSDIDRELKAISYNKIKPNKSGNKSYECPICQKLIAGYSNSNLKRHIETVHEKEKEYKCEICPIKFASINALFNHMKEEHMQIKASKSKDCNKNFSRELDMETHEKKVHLSKKPSQRYTCNECETSFEQKQQIESHINSVHLNERPYKQRGYADLEPQFTLKKKEGERLLYICNLCKPKNSVISVNVKSRSNLKRHLTSQHSKKDVENYEGIKKKKKEISL